MPDRSNDISEAAAAFIARKAEIDAMLRLLVEISDDNFGLDPEHVHWGHVGDLEEHAALLRRIVDRVFREGEFAP